MQTRLIIASYFALMSVGGTLQAADWPMFRGPARDGISSEADLPQQWSAQKNVRWKAPLPGPGNSSPVVAGDRVFVTVSTERGRQRSLMCLSRADGKTLWTKSITYEKSDPTHGTNPHGAATPAVDIAGKRVFVSHGSAGLYAYDLDGNPLWSADLGSARHIWGYASSPVVHGDAVILNFGPGDNSAVICLDAATGQVRWRMPYAGNSSLDDANQDTKKWTGSWGSPLVRRIGGQDQIVVALPQRVVALDPATGKELWTISGLSDLVYTDVLLSDPAGDGSIIGVAMSGFTGPAVGFRVPAAAAGDITSSARLWRVEKNPQRIGSGVLIDGHVYMPNENGLACIDALTGAETWRNRPEGSTFWSPTVATRDRVYFTSQRGTTFVVAPDPKAFRLLASNPLDEKANASPALAHGQIFIRTFDHLYCIDE